MVSSLKGDVAFQRLRKGRTGGSRLLSVRWRPRRDPGLRVGIVVSRKVGNAVVRNRVRRRLREGLRALLAERADRSDGGPAGVDLVIIARPEAARADYAALRSSLDRSLQRSAFP